MKANRLIMIGLIAASLLAGCKKKDDNNTNSHLNMDGISFSASTEQHDRNTRTYLEGEDIKWMNGDKILVTNSANQQGEFEVTGGIRTTNGTFHSANDFDQAPEYNAAYPFGIASISGTTATFTMSGTQTITATGTFANGAMPMVAHSTDETLNFRNVLGGLCLPIKGAGISVTKIVLTSSNTNEMLWGTFNADCTSSDPNPTNISGGTNVLELVCNPAVELQGAQSQDFVFMIPEGTLQTGFTFAVYSTGTEPVYSKTVSFPDDNFDPERFLINRSRIRKVNTDINIEAALTVTTNSPTFISYEKAWMGGTVTGGNPVECGVIYATPATISYDTNNLKLSDVVEKVNMTDNLSSSSYKNWSHTLAPDVIYYVRAYATSASGETYYGYAIPFASRKDYEHVYHGRLEGAFSVDNGVTRHFAMGNLQYKPTDATWYYADYQFEYIGYIQNYGNYEDFGNVFEDGEQPIASDNHFRSDNTGVDAFSDLSVIDTEEEVNTSNNSYNDRYPGKVDWFTWGSSGYNHSNLPPDVTPFYQPYCRIKSYTPNKIEGDHGYYEDQPFRYFNNFYGPYDTYYYIGGNATTNLSLANGADWAINTIQNGSASGKYTISSAEWDYLLNTRSAGTVNGKTDARYSFAILNVRNGEERNIVKGIFLFPDDFEWPETYVKHYPLHINDYFVTTWDNVAVFTEAEWSLLEHSNMVFLPASGCYGKSGHAEWGNLGGRYWTSTAVAPTETTSGGANDFAFSPVHTHGEGIVNAYAVDHKFYGFAVRFMMP